MINKTIQLSALLLLAIPNVTYSAVLEEDNTSQQDQICQALAILKCSLYKLEAITFSENCETETANEQSQVCAAIDIIKCTAHKLQNILDAATTDCPSLDFDDSCPPLDFDDSCGDHDYSSCDDNKDCCNLANLPVNININCNHTEKVKLYLKIQTCKKLKQETNS